MDTKGRQFQLRTLFVTTSVFAVLIATFAYDVFSAYLMSIAIVAGLTNLLSRYHYGQTKVIAGIHGVFTGAAWGALLGGICISIALDPITGFFAFWVGGTIGIMISLVPVLIIALANALYPRRNAAPIPPPDLSIPRIKPYTDTQGY